MSKHSLRVTYDLLKPNCTIPRSYVFCMLLWHLQHAPAQQMVCMYPLLQFLASTGQTHCCAHIDWHWKVCRHHSSPYYTA
jgi:hypothetical protein